MKFVHAADLHLDSPSRGLRAETATSQRIGGATRVAFQRIVDLCLREQVDFLLLAGDLYEQRDASIRARLWLAEGLAALDRAGIRTFIVHGNHDPLSAHVARLSLPASVKVFGSAWEEETVRCRDGTICKVQGISHATERTTDDLATLFHRTGPELTIGLLHTNLGARAEHGNYAPSTPDGLDRAGLDYWALGHIHRRDVLQLPRGGLAVYPGNPQGRHITEDGARGCFLVEGRQGSLSLRFVPVDSARWSRLDLACREDSTVDAVLREVVEAARALALEASGVEIHLARVTLTGATALHTELTQKHASSSLEELMRERLAALRPPVVLESLRDETHRPFDLEALERSGGLPGLMAKAGMASTPELIDQIYADGDLAALEGALARAGLPSTRGAAPALIQRGTAAALETLLGGGRA